MSGGRFENWSGIGMTLLDGLDTLELLGLHKEFEKAAEWVETRSNFDIDRSFSVFETTIRVVGGPAQRLRTDPKAGVFGQGGGGGRATAAGVRHAQRVPARGCIGGV